MKDLGTALQKSSHNVPQVLQLGLEKTDDQLQELQLLGNFKTFGAKIHMSYVHLSMGHIY